MAKFSNADLELALINACIHKNDLIDQISSLIKPNDFSTPTTKRVYEYLLVQINSGASIDFAQAKSALPDVPASFWQELMLQNRFIDAKSYAKSLRDLSLKEQLFEISTQTASELTSVTDVIDYTHSLNNKLYKVLAGISDSDLKTSSQAVNEFYEQYQKMAGMLDKSIVGTSTGFSIINYHTKGFKPGELIVLAARPGQGKTTLALNIVLNVLEENKGVVFYSLEMTAASLMTKLIAINTQISMQDLTLGSVADEDMMRLQESAQNLASKNMLIFDKGVLTPEMLRASLRRAKDEMPNLSLVVLDYIGLMSFSGPQKERFAQISEISRQLKLLALELQLPILVLSQLNRNVESKDGRKDGPRAPQLSDIRDSGSIEQDADMIFFIHPLTKHNQEYLASKEIDLESLHRPCVINLAKNRSGALAEMYFDFLAHKSTFVALDLRGGNGGQPLSATAIG